MFLNLSFIFKINLLLVVEPTKSSPEHEQHLILVKWLVVCLYKLYGVDKLTHDEREQHYSEEKYKRSGDLLVVGHWVEVTETDGW